MSQVIFAHPRRLQYVVLSIVMAAMVMVGAYVVGSSHAATVNGDVNADGKVDVTDLSLLLSSWGTSNQAADFNNDGTVNIFDLSRLLSNWGKTGATPTPSLSPTPSVTSSPTPSALASCTTSGATGAGSPAKIITVAVPSGDMTSAIKNALSSASGGGKVVLQAGTYTISSTLSVPSGVDFTGASMTATTIRASDTSNVDPMITVPSGSSNVTVENMTVNQNGASAAARQSLAAYMVETRGTNTIFQRIATRLPSTYSMVAAGASKFCFRNNNVLNDPALNAKYNQLDGIHILSSSNGDVVDNYVDNSYNGATAGDDGLVVHAYGGPVNNVRYQGNVVRGGSNGTAIAVWDYNNDAANIVITGNEIWGSGRIGHGDGFGGNAGSFNNSKITNNVIHNISGNGISIAGSSLIVTGNRLCSAGAVSVTGSGNTVSNNTAYTGCSLAPSTTSPPPVIP